MICETIRKGMDCSFMTKKGCSYKEGLCYEIVQQCEGCNRTVEISTRWYCTAFPEPSTRWKSGTCSMASHATTVVVETKAKVNPLKASKRGSK